MLCRKITLVGFQICFTLLAIKIFSEVRFLLNLGFCCGYILSILSLSVCHCMYSPMLICQSDIVKKVSLFQDCAWFILAVVNMGLNILLIFKFLGREIMLNRNIPSVTPIQTVFIFLKKYMMHLFPIFLVFLHEHVQYGEAFLICYEISNMCCYTVCFIHLGNCRWNYMDCRTFYTRFLLDCNLE